MASQSRSAAHPYETFLGHALPASAAQRRWTPEDGALPALYLSHGAPPLLEDEVWMKQLLDWSLSLPKPRNVLIVSAHWESAPLSLSGSAAGTPLVYDFGGFAQLYYEMTYADPGRRRARPAGRRGDAGRRDRCTSTPGAVSTTAPGCR